MRARVACAASWALLPALLVITAGAYLPGLSGPFVYDDTSFIVGNALVHVGSADPRDWIAAAFSFPGGHQGRWLGMLSFAANYYFGALDPFGYKLVNLLIHLVNGVLVFLMLRALFALCREVRASRYASSPFDERLAAAAIAGLWLVLPINLTAVLYVSQRLESLSNMLVFLGLYWYLRARIRYWRGERGPTALWLSLFLCTAVGVLIKEAAALLPLYAACIEFTVTRARNRDGKLAGPIGALYLVFLLAPMILGLYWLSTWIAGPTTYARSFDSGQRLLSEARVLVEYIRWSLAPSLDVLTLHHDDILASRGLLDPPSTLAAVSALGVVAGLAIRQRAHKPMFSLGVAWFFCGHLLTGTIIPLLLAFEHRNYFPSVGLLLAAASLVALEGGLRSTRLRIAAAAMLIAFYAFTTWMRAQEWSDPMRLAVSEASKRPASPTAQYDLAVLLAGTGARDGQSAIDDAEAILEKNRTLPEASTLYESGLITLASRQGKPVDAAWWDSLIGKLRSRPPSINDAGALEQLNACFSDGGCKEGQLRLAEAYSVALAHPSPDPYLLSSHGNFAWHVQDDEALAEREFRRTIERSPHDPQARRHLVLLLISMGQLDQAELEIDAIRRMNRFGLFDKLIGGLESRRLAKAAQPRSP